MPQRDRYSIRFNGSMATSSHRIRLAANAPSPPRGTRQCAGSAFWTHVPVRNGSSPAWRCQGVSTVDALNPARADDLGVSDHAFGLDNGDAASATAAALKSPPRSTRTTRNHEDVVGAVNLTRVGGRPAERTVKQHSHLMSRLVDRVAQRADFCDEIPLPPGRLRLADKALDLSPEPRSLGLGQWPSHGDRVGHAKKGAMSGRGEVEPGEVLNQSPRDRKSVV